MRIGIGCYPTVGGSGVVATELARALALGGDEVHLLSYAVPPRWSWAGPRLFFHEVAVRQYPLFEYPPYSLALATKMVEVARQQDLDLLHVHYAIPNAVSAILARQILAPMPMRVITTLHGTDITLVGHDPSYIETTRFSILQSDAVTAVSEWLRQVTVDKLGIDEKPIEVIPNFVDPERYREAVARRGSRRWTEEGERLLIHVSNLRPVKRVDDVMHIFHRVAQELPARLLLVGDGPELSRAEQIARELGIRERIHIVGTVALVEDLLVHADLFLLPSETESFGLAALEAMACGVPVVASDVGGLPEVIEDGVSGFLRPVGDVAGMASAALRLLRNDEERWQFGEAARIRAAERYSIDKVV
ncbi:MAG: N-acetyl-alpha-D-glucosaminyl L-malate synthase BshA, partial [Thermoanaerobaculia bacterium]|nr:N-acetyl-alpha-D-glucosaminyl L-malate synthase BshA [Thermoanaerobaculia bacterium]